MNTRCFPVRWLGGFWLSLLFTAPVVHAELFTNLQALPDRIAVGDPQISRRDGNGGAKRHRHRGFRWRPEAGSRGRQPRWHHYCADRVRRRTVCAPRHVRTGARELRTVLAADLNGDGMPDLAARPSEDGKLLVYFNQGNSTFRRGPASGVDRSAQRGCRGFRRRRRCRPRGGGPRTRWADPAASAAAPSRSWATCVG